MGILLGILWIVLGILTTRKVFRIAIPRAMQFPTIGNYVIAWVLIFIWWTVLGYLLTFLEPLFT